MTSLQADIRQGTGKGAARKLRATGKIPCVVYGPDDAPVSVAVDPNALVDIFDATKNRNTVVDLVVDGKTVPCLVREVQRHPVSRVIEHVDFYRLAGAREVEVVVPVVVVGKPVGAVLGGRIRVIRRTLLAACVPGHIPEKFEIDVTPLDVGQSVKASELKLPEGVRLVARSDFFVVTCYGKKVRAGEKA